MMQSEANEKEKMKQFYHSYASFESKKQYQLSKNSGLNCVWSSFFCADSKFQLNERWKGNRVHLCCWFEKYPLCKWCQWKEELNQQWTRSFDASSHLFVIPFRSRVNFFWKSPTANRFGLMNGFSLVEYLLNSMSVEVWSAQTIFAPFISHDLTTMILLLWKINLE